jgi:hypothetical protein
MRITSPVACLVAIMLLVGTIAPTAFAQQARGDWTAVQSLPADENISVKLKTGKRVRGEFLSASDNELTITRKGKSESFAKDAIAQIERLEGKLKGKYALIGAGVGTAAGAGQRSRKGGCWMTAMFTQSPA